MVSEESRLFMMKNYKKMQDKREKQIKQRLINQFHSIIVDSDDTDEMLWKLRELSKSSQKDKKNEQEKE